jgi:hypothetical protein
VRAERKLEPGIRRMNRPPEPEDTFLMRVCYALDVSPRMLAKGAGVSYSDQIVPLMRPYYEIAGTPAEDTWWAISQYVNQRLGEMLAAQQELQRHMQSSRAKRAARTAETLAMIRRLRR